MGMCLIDDDLQPLVLDAGVPRIRLYVVLELHMLRPDSSQLRCLCPWPWMLDSLYKQFDLHVGPDKTS